MRTFTAFVLTILAVLLAWTAAPTRADDGNDTRPMRRVLLLHSYNPEVQYTRLQDAAIRSSIESHFRGFVHYSVEYMDLLDAVRDHEYRLRLADLYERKYRWESWDLIITTDAGALAFLDDEGADLFREVPVVFSAVRDEQARIDRNARPITGVMESLDIAETVQLARSLHPNSKRLVAITDDTTHGWVMRWLAEPVLEKLEGTKVAWVQPLKTGQADPTVGLGLQPTDIVLFLAHYDDNGLPILDRDSLLSRFCRNSPAPVYACYDAYLGAGIVGGMLASGEHQGRSAGLLAARVLSGESASEIPIVTESPNEYMFDLRALKRWGIPESALPAGSVIRYRNTSFFEQNRRYVLIGAAAFAAQGMIIALLLVAHSRRRRAERHLRDERDLLDTIMRSAPAGIIMFNAGGEITFANEFAEKMLGLPFDAIASRKWDDAEWAISDSEGRALHRDEIPVARIFKDGMPIIDFECSVAKPDGDRTHVTCNGIPLRESDGSIRAVLFTMEDITRRKRDEAALVRAKAELEDRVRARTAELLEANRQLRSAIRERHQAETESREHRDELARVQRVATMGEMATGLAHEINQPLSAIVSFTQGCIRRLDAGTADPNELRNALSEVSAQAQRAGEIIRGIRAFIRKDRPGLCNLSVNDVAHSAIDMLRAEMKAASIVLKTDFADDVPIVQADAVQLEQVFINVVKNAIDALPACDPAARNIIIRTAVASGGEAIIEISDNGPGIAHELLPRVFEPFLTTKPSGLGMGLAISRSIIEAYGGRMGIVNGLADGTTVRITLPAAYQIVQNEPVKAGVPTQ